MSSKKQGRIEEQNLDYEELSHTQKQKKTGIRDSFLRRSKQEVCDIYGFDDEEEAEKYSKFIQ